MLEIQKLELRQDFAGRKKVVERERKERRSVAGPSASLLTSRSDHSRRHDTPSRPRL